MLQRKNPLLISLFQKHIEGRQIFCRIDLTRGHGAAKGQSTCSFFSPLYDADLWILTSGLCWILQCPGQGVDVCELDFLHLAQSDVVVSKSPYPSPGWERKWKVVGKGSRNSSHLAPHPETDLLSSPDHKNSLRKLVSQRCIRLAIFSIVQQTSGIRCFSVFTITASLPG